MDRMNTENSNRREFLGTGGKLALVAAGITLFGCKNDEEKEVSPPEDLMQEHGLLNRVLLIYDFAKQKLSDKADFDKSKLTEAAMIIRTFVEDYHEKQEEDYLFPRFEKKNTLTGLVATLRVQHKRGREITQQIMELSKRRTTLEEDWQLLKSLENFNRMYRPHEAREDTVLFPAFRKIVSRHEYDSLGEEFEKNEHRLFGEDGFEKMVDKVAEIEKAFGINDLAAFTPAANG
jgi:hemerythrin-like domain-containing protein